MANRAQVQLLKQGVQQWNRWRSEHPHIRPDLSGADLGGAELKNADLRDSNLTRATLRGAHLSKAQLSGANLSGANLKGARLRGAYLRGANLRHAILRDANLRYTNLAQADLQGADLRGAAVYGIAAWNIKGEPANEAGMLLNRSKQSAVPVDNLELAQFLHLLREHEKLRRVINTSTGRLVLLLGGFKRGGLERLRIVAGQLKDQAYLPVIFDFERPDEHSYIDTVQILASLSRFVVADLSGPSVPFELGTLIPHHMIPFVLMRQAGRAVFAMAPDLILRSYWVFPPFEYSDHTELKRLVKSKIIKPAEAARAAYADRIAALYLTDPSTKRAVPPSAPVVTYRSRKRPPGLVRRSAASTAVR
jgi:hypothetical protein